MDGRFSSALAARPLLLDAAMGTRLMALGLDLAADDPALWNLARPEAVLDVHARDVAAGSDALLTNTFGANPAWLDRYGKASQTAEINRRAVALARDAAGPDRFVLGSIGPTAGWSESGHASQADVLAEAGVDALFLETHTPGQAVAGLRQVRRRFAGPILVGIISTIDEDEWHALIDHGTDVLGKNCCHPLEILDWVQRLDPVRTGMIPLLSEPYASDPDRGPIAPADFAGMVPGLLSHGVRLLGGCCGATEAHVAALRHALDREWADRV